MIAILCLSLTLRFWGLGRFNTLVFDEVYYVKFAKNYLTQTPYFDGHPPFSKYVLAIAIWLGNLMPIGRDTVNDQAGLPFSTFSYRWFNALTGSWIPLLLGGIAYQLSKRRTYALLVALFASLDGMLLVESRYALNNTHVLLLGLLGLWLLLLSLESSQSLLRMGLLTTAGIAFGLATAVKWNGLWFLLGVYGLIAIARVICWWPYRSSPPDAPINPLRPTQTPRWLRQLSRLSLWQIALYLAVVPFVFYALSWLPHLLLCQTDPQGLCRPYLSQSANVDLSPPSLPGLFFELNTQILSYHQRVGGNAPSVHPYCSAWFTWLFMLRPIAYFYQVTPKDAPLPAGQWKLPPSEDTVIYDVHSMGNPLLWWLSLGAIGLLLLSLGEQLVAHLKQRAMNSPSAGQALPPAPTAESDLQPAASIPWGVPLFLLVNYAANLLPWVRVTRCTFLYHYLSASVFAWMALAWFCDRWLVSREPAARWFSLAIILGIGLAFLFWLPIYLGLPLSPLEFQWRMWFRSWV